MTSLAAHTLQNARGNHRHYQLHAKPGLTGDWCAGTILNLEWKLWKWTIKLTILLRLWKLYGRKSVVFMFRFQPPTTIFYTSSSINVIDLIDSFSALWLVAHFKTIITITHLWSSVEQMTHTQGLCWLGNKSPECKLLLIFKFWDWTKIYELGYWNFTKEISGFNVQLHVSETWNPSCIVRKENNPP